MRLTTLLSAVASASLATAAAIEPRSAPRNLKVIGLSVLGTGCPYGSADVQTDPSNTELEVRLSDYIVQTGANVPASEWRKNCKITMNLEYDAGFSYVYFSLSFTYLHISVIFVYGPSRLSPRPWLLGWVLASFVPSPSFLRHFLRTDKQRTEKSSSR